MISTTSTNPLIPYLPPLRLADFFCVPAKCTLAIKRSPNETFAALKFAFRLRSPYFPNRPLRLKVHPLVSLIRQIGNSSSWPFITI